jgi:hypothetical protein
MFGHVRLVAPFFQGGDPQLSQPLKQRSWIVTIMPRGPGSS